MDVLSWCVHVMWVLLQVEVEYEPVPTIQPSYQTATRTAPGSVMRILIARHVQPRIHLNVPQHTPFNQNRNTAFMNEL